MSSPDLERPAGRWAVGVLTVLSLFLLVLIIRPFASALFVAAVLAGAFHRWTMALSARMGGRRNLAAGLVTAAIVLVVVIPSATLIVSIGGEVANGAAYVSRTLSAEGLQGLIDDLPPGLRPLAQKGAARLPRQGGELPDIGVSGGRAAAAVGGVLSATWGAVVQLTFMVIALFFLLAEGAELVDWAVRVVPLGETTTRSLLADFRRVSVGVLVSSLATSGVQTAVALAGYLIAGVPQLPFFVVVTFLLSLVPAVGATGAGLVAAAVVLLGGHTGMAIFLAIWSVLVVGLADNVVKPWLIKGRVELHGAVVFFALIGGLTVFGPVGLVAGPLIVSFFMTVIRLRERQKAETGV